MYEVTIEDFWLTFLVSTVLPAATAFITKRLASSHTKAMVLLALTIITGAATGHAASGGGPFDLKAVTVGFFVSFITASAIHFGLLKPLGVTGTDGAIARAVPGGVGSEDPAKVVQGTVVSDRTDPPPSTFSPRGTDY